MRKLHVGCGPRYLPGYIHIDQDKYDHVEHVCDIRRLYELYPPGVQVADEIYACQVLAYFDPVELPTILGTWMAMLTPGGILRLSVPDFERLAELYMAGIPLDWMLGTLYGRRSRKGENNDIQFHKTTFDYPRMARLLEETGFHPSKISPWDPKSVFPDDYYDLSMATFPPPCASAKYANRQRIRWNLNIKAVK